MRLLITGSDGTLTQERTIPETWVVHFEATPDGTASLGVTQLAQDQDGAWMVVTEEPLQTYLRTDYGKIQVLDENGQVLLATPPLQIGPGR